MRCALALFSILVATSALSDVLERGRIVDNIASQSDPTQTYAYYVPSTYDPASRWPILFVFDPRQRGAFAAELFRESAELYGWIIVSSNNTHSNMPLEQNARAMQAMWSDAPRRFSIDGRRVYAAGFSGGAIMAWWLGRATKMVAGVIACGGRLNDPHDLEGVTFDWYGLVGDTDFNYTEMRDIEKGLAASNVRSRLEVFKGAHRWAPLQQLREAIDWMEVQAMRRGGRARDEDFLRAQLETEMRSARALEKSEDLASALRAYENIERTFESLIATDQAHDRAEQLRQQPSVRRVLFEEQKAIEFEESFRGTVPRLIREYLTAPEEDSTTVFSAKLRIPYLKKIARQRTPQGLAAERLLAMMFVQLSRTAEELDGAQRKDQAAKLRMVAHEIR